jgi:hypothetical protein
MEDESPVTNSVEVVKRVDGSSEYFNRSESVCCGGKLVQWFGRVTPSFGVQKVQPTWHCMICSKPCETRLNKRFRDTSFRATQPSPTPPQTAKGDPNLPTPNLTTNT